MRIRDSIVFEPELAGCVGVERECFTFQDGAFAPVAQQVIAAGPRSWIGYELSSYQIETRTDPCRIEALEDSLIALEAKLTTVMQSLGITHRYIEVAPSSLPLTVYPNPRYLELAVTMPRQVLSAACRIAGTHIHIGMRDADMALRSYNRLAQQWREFLRLGDGSDGQRASLYHTVVPSPAPPVYESWDHFEAIALREEFAANLRDCWHFVRLTRHGTVEVRCFGATEQIEKIVAWARVVLDSCH